MGHVSAVLVVELAVKCVALVAPRGAGLSVVYAQGKSFFAFFVLHAPS